LRPNALLQGRQDHGTSAFVWAGWHCDTFLIVEAFGSSTGQRVSNKEMQHQSHRLATECCSAVARRRAKHWAKSNPCGPKSDQHLWGQATKNDAVVKNCTFRIHMVPFVKMMTDFWRSRWHLHDSDLLLGRRRHRTSSVTCGSWRLSTTKTI